MKLLILLPMLFLLLTQPFTLSLILTFQTTMLGIMIYWLNKNIWMSLVLILVMVGGLMISFVYICSLMPNEPFVRNSMWLTPFMLFLIMIGFMIPFNFSFKQSLTEFCPITLFSSVNLMPMLFIVLILVLALLVVCTNTLQVKNPMRSFS